MREKETHAAAREALKEVTDRPERVRGHEEELVRYLGGVAYHEEQAEARDKRDRSTEEDRR